MLRSMVFLSLALVISAGRASGGDVTWCDAPAPIGPLVDPLQATVKVRIVFAAFPGADSTLPAWADSLRNDLRRYCVEMSGNPSWDLDMKIVKRPGPDSLYAWVTGEPYSYYLSGGHYVNHDILTTIAETYNPESYWSDTDAILTVHFRRIPAYFSAASRFATTGLSWDSEHTSQVPSLDYGPHGHTQGTTQEMETKPRRYPQEQAMAHELMHLFNYHHPPNGAQVNYGRYNLMGTALEDSLVWEEGLIPMHPFELAKDGVWAPQPEVIAESRLDVPLPDFFSKPRAERKSYRIILSTAFNNDQFFFLVNHKGSVSDSLYQGSGLLIWHMLRPLDLSFANDGGWDLEVASGKSPNPVSGLDALEASTLENPYYGSASDFFDGVTHTEFSYNTNPNTNMYAADAQGVGHYRSDQSVHTTAAVENIRRESGSGNMLVDVYTSHVQFLEPQNVGNGGSIQRGSTVSVQWRARPSLGASTVDLQISEDGGSHWRDLATGIANTGSFSWPVLQKEGTNYRLRLITHGPGGLLDLPFDTSDSAIAINDNRSCPP